MTALPELGVGIVYWPGMQHLVEPVGEVLDVLEIEPQPFWFPPTATENAYRVDQRALDQLSRLPYPKIVHGVGFPIGGTAVPCSTHLEPFAKCIAALGAAWASEHLSFNRVGSPEKNVDVGFLLPPVQSYEGVAVAASNIRTVKTSIPVPFAFETGVNYLRPLEGEISDGAYFAAVAEAADCGILLDLHNLWANERNGRQRVLELVEELPLDRVWEVHVADGQELDGFWVDAHSGLAPRELLDLARHIVPSLPSLKAIIFEAMPEYLSEKAVAPEEFLDQLLELREIWSLRGTRTSLAVGRSPIGLEPIQKGVLPSPRMWEEALASAVSGIEVDRLGEQCLANDPGVAVLRRLVDSVRAGKATTALRLTTRLLLLTLGEDGVQDVFERFWRAVPSEPLASEEARRFATFLEQHVADSVPFLRETMAFELAAHAVLIDGQPRVLRFQHDVRSILAALLRGRRPNSVQSGEFEVTVE